MQTETSIKAGSFLDDVLVVTLHKGFWASRECQVFPHRIYEKRIFKHSQNRPNSYITLSRALLYTILHKPRVILIGNAHKLVPRFIKLKRRGYLEGTKLIATNQLLFDDAGAHYVDKIIVYARSEVALHDAKLASKYEFIPIAADGEFDSFQLSKRGTYIFSGASHGVGRDFQSLIEAVRGLDVRLKIVAFSVQALGYTGSLPENCEFHGFMPQQNFIELMADSLFVVVPLTGGGRPSGHTTVAQALALGKAVVTTKNAGVDDYITDDSEGILVSPGDVRGYREAIIRLQSEPGFLDSCEKKARIKARELTNQAYAERLADLCHNALTS